MNDDYEKHLKEVMKNGYDLRDVPEEHKTFDLCFEAVKKYRGYLQFVPEDIKQFIDKLYRI
jgi:hypothetical protein